MKYEYNREIEPPALMLPAEITDIGKRSSIVIDAKIDTGADISTIPERVIMNLNLKPSDFVEARGPFYGYKVVATYLIFVKFENGREFRLKVISSKNSFMLFGRDALNDMVLLANGPKEFFTLD